MDPGWLARLAAATSCASHWRYRRNGFRRRLQSDPRRRWQRDAMIYLIGPASSSDAAGAENYSFRRPRCRGFSTKSCRLQRRRNLHTAGLLVLVAAKIARRARALQPQAHKSPRHCVSGHPVIRLSSSLACHHRLKLGDGRRSGDIEFAPVLPPLHNRAAICDF